jgi:phospholipid N-methyltransferase
MPRGRFDTTIAPGNLPDSMAHEQKKKTITGFRGRFHKGIRMTAIICRGTFCKHIFCNAAEKLQATGIFLREFIQAPSHVGSVCPSSKALIASIINTAPLHGNDLIVDLGAGSGTVSEELVNAGVSPNRIVAVEISDGFSRVFSKRCPDVPLVIGDARSLQSILTRHSPDGRVGAVISSLPLRVMPPDDVSEIMAELRNVLVDKGGVLIQYTYAWWMRYPLSRHGFIPRSVDIVPANIPPAKVESYVV